MSWLCELLNCEETAKKPVKKEPKKPGPKPKKKSPYEIARGYLGQKEIKGSKHNPVIQSFFQRAVGKVYGDETSWCAAFVNSCLVEAGYKGTNSLTARSGLKIGNKVTKPEQGDIVVFWRSSPKSWKGHIGFVVRELKNDIVVLGGNQGNAVSEKRYPKSRVLGYRRVADYPDDHGNWKAPNFAYLYEKASIDSDRVDEVKRTCDKIFLNKDVYYAVATKVNKNMPWWFVPVLHYRESSLSFNGVLHNGDRIIGTGKKTTHVPKGRGPFSTWEEAAIDALRRFKNHKDWDIANCLEKCERFNGLGYRKNAPNEYSPYVWAGTTIHDETGKYVADGRFSATAKEKQLGVAALIKQLTLV